MKFTPPQLMMAACLSVLLFACNNAKQSDTDTGSTPLPTDSVDQELTAGPELAPEDYYMWKVDPADKTMRKNPKLGDDQLSADTLIMGLNEMYPQVKLEKDRMGHDTLYTHIADSDYLTQKMGSAGAETYLAQAVLNLTSASGVRFVRIDFEPGDHAEPDVWNRESFKDYKIVQ